MEHSRQPIFNLPGAMVAAVVLLLLIHMLRLPLSPFADAEVLYTFGFVPARFAPPPGLPGEFPGGAGADVWTFVTYALLHGDWMHLFVNVAWMVAFGTPVLRRFGLGRFLLLSVVAAVAGALAHLVTNWGATAPMIGASAAVSGQMAAAIRFAFQPGGPMSARPAPGEWRWRMPALPMNRALRDVRVAAFIGIWFLINLAFGAGAGIPGESAGIAWQAHIGGFLAGFLLFRLFDPWWGVPPDPWREDGQAPRERYGSMT